MIFQIKSSFLKIIPIMTQGVKITTFVELELILIDKSTFLKPLQYFTQFGALDFKVTSLHLTCFSL